jgi:hypothetical protein
MNIDTSMSRSAFLLNTSPTETTASSSVKPITSGATKSQMTSTFWKNSLESKQKNEETPVKDPREKMQAIMSLMKQAITSGAMTDKDVAKKTE